MTQMPRLLEEGSGTALTAPDPGMHPPEQHPIPQKGHMPLLSAIPRVHSPRVALPLPSQAGLWLLTHLTLTTDSDTQGKANRSTASSFSGAGAEIAQSQQRPEPPLPQLGMLGVRSGTTTAPLPS